MKIDGSWWLKEALDWRQCEIELTILSIDAAKSPLVKFASFLFKQKREPPFEGKAPHLVI